MERYPELPQHIQSLILKNCKNQDLRNFSCCSQECNALAKQILWTSVKVPLQRSRLVTPTMLHNMKYVSKLHLCGGQKRDDAEESSSTFEAGYNMCLVLNACDPLKVRTLELYNVPVYCAHKALDLFRNITALSLLGQTLNEGMIAHINALENLEQLSFMESLENISAHINLQNFEDMFAIGHLKELQLVYVSGEYEAFIRRCVNLEHLTIASTRSGDWQSLFYLGELPRLQSLDIQNFHLGTGTLLHLSNQLYDLKSLKIKTCCFAAGDFANINMLTSLTDLCIYDLLGELPASCLVDISRSTSLKHLTLPYGPLVRNEENPKAKDEVKCFNTMASIENLTVTGGFARVTPVIQVLCSEKAWRVEVVRGGVIFSS